MEKWQVWNGAGGEGERASGMRSAFLACALGECGWWDPENKDKALSSMRGPRGSPAMWAFQAQIPADAGLLCPRTATDPWHLHQQGVWILCRRQLTPLRGVKKKC